MSDSITDISRDELIQAQKVMLYIMKKVHDICVKHNIKYWLDYGSLLGAIRHGGFIPWDDDMDICMMREDYEKFASIAQDELGDEFFWQSPETEPNFYPEFGRVRLNGTIWLGQGWAKAGLQHNGFFLDIFPMDPFPKSRFKIKLMLFYKAVANCVIAYKVLKPPSPNFFKRTIQGIISFFIPAKSLKWCSRRIISGLQKYNQRTNLISKLCLDTERDLCDKALLENVVLKPFEDAEFFVPERYDERLKMLFKDYMQLPPEDKRYGHHGIAKFDFGKYKNL